MRRPHDANSLPSLRPPKPAGLPVHPAGQFRKNTVLGVVGAQRPELGPLHPVHRLDLPVSGLLLLARTKPAAERLCAAIQAGSVHKTYVARVAGVFPDTSDGDLRVETMLGWDPRTNLAFVGGTVASSGTDGDAAAPPPKLTDEQIGGRDGERLRALKAKNAVTCFRRLWVAPDGSVSVVQARPLTGRTHQIRVHLQHVGHGIVNDAKYGPQAVRPTGPDSRLVGCLGCRTRAQHDAATESGEWVMRADFPEAELCSAPLATTSPKPAATADEGAGPAGKRARTEPADQGADDACGAGACWDGDKSDPLCVHCPHIAPRGHWCGSVAPLWLHAVRYAGDGWAYECPAPVWAEQTAEGQAET